MQIEVLLYLHLSKIEPALPVEGASVCSPVQFAMQLQSQVFVGPDHLHIDPHISLTSLWFQRCSAADLHIVLHHGSEHLSIKE